MGMWTVAVGRFSHNLPDVFASRVIAVLGLLSSGFLLFTLLTAHAQLWATTLPSLAALVSAEVSSASAGSRCASNVPLTISPASVVLA